MQFNSGGIVVAIRSREPLDRLDVLIVSYFCGSDNCSIERPYSSANN